MVKFETDRLIVRLPNALDAADICAFYTKNRNFLTPWEPFHDEGFFTENYWHQRLQLAQLELSKDMALRLILRIKENDHLCGLINVVNFERGAFQSCRMGYKLDEDLQGQGLMVEALEPTLDFIFNRLRLHRVEANYATTNTRSARVLDKLGFEKVGVAPKYLQLNGEWVDHVLTQKVHG